MFKIWSSRPTRNYKILYSNIGLWILLRIRSQAAQNFWPDTTPIYDSLTVIKSNNDPTKFNLKKKLTFSYSFCTVKFSTCNRCSSQVTKDFLIIIQKYFALFCKCRLKLRISFFAKVWAGQKWTGSATLGEHVVKSKDVEANRRQKHCTVWLVLNVQQPAKQKNCFSKWRRPIVHIVIL